MKEIRQTKSARRAKSRSFDKALGERVKALRLGTGMSQTDLAVRLGFSYQQMQKYETGKDRLSAHTLREIATILATPVATFFDDGPIPTGSVSEIREVMKAVTSIQAIKHPKVRRHLLAFIQEVARTCVDDVKHP